jgi:hypothetical protein
MQTPVHPRCPGCGCWRAYDLTTCSGCLYLVRRARERGTGRRCNRCSTPLPEGQILSRCDTCQEARAAEDFDYRRRQAAERFPAVVRRLLLARLREGEGLSQSCRSLELSTQQVHGFKVFDAEWAEALDAALLAGRDPGLEHGTFNAYRHGGCRCPECREYKLGHDSWGWRRPRLPAPKAELGVTRSGSIRPRDL